MLLVIRFVLLSLFSLQLWAGAMSFAWYTTAPDQHVILNVELFISSTCPYCHKADVFFKEIEPSTPWLHVHRHLINEDKSALDLFNQFLTDQNARDFSVPSIFFCNSRWLGFDSEQTTGNDLLKALAYCKNDIEKEGRLTDETIITLRQWANANGFNTSNTEQSGAMVYILGALLSLLVAFFGRIFFSRYRNKK
jgi:glutaredoxin